MMFAWIGSPDTVSVPMPWAKAGTIAAPRSGSILLALIQEESNGYCEVRYVLPGQTTWTELTGAQCSSNVDGALVEGTVGLPAEFGVAASSIPSFVHTAAIEIGAANGGTLDTGLQTPTCVTCNANIESDEVITTHRARLLVGRVQP